MGDNLYRCHMQPKRSLRPNNVKQTLIEDADALNSAVSDLVRVYQFRDRDRICCYDISVTQCYALETLVEHGPMRSQSLAERLLLDKGMQSDPLPRTMRVPFPCK
jgi:MarR family 2-MHQ and catechol resistance regulon transcriptional repressor